MPVDFRNNAIQIVLGFDFGLSHIGYAIGQTITRTAQPIGVLKARQGMPDMNEIKRLIQAWEADALIVGLPYDLFDQESYITQAARQFSIQLSEETRLPIFQVDEKLSSKEARYRLKSYNQRYNKKQIDAISAQIIVETWLNLSI